MGLLDLATAGAGIVGGILGGIGGSDKNTGATSTTVDPWKAQQPYLKTGFGAAAGLYNQYANAPYYQGQLYAGMNPYQTGAADSAANYATGQGMALSPGMINDSRQFLGQGQNYINSANRLASWNPQDPTQQNIYNAGQYANNPYLNGAIDAASRDVTRNLTEDVLPGINRGASGAGNTNSTRTGIAEGVALRGAQDRIGDIASTIRADAYNNGIQTSEGARQANMGSYLQGQGMGADALYNAFGKGMDLRNQGMQGSVNMMDLMGRAGDKYQQDQQGYANANLQRWQGQYDQPWNALSRYMGNVGGSNWGSSTQSTVNGAGGFMGGLQGALGGAASGMGLYQNFSNLLNSGQQSPQNFQYQA